MHRHSLQQIPRIPKRPPHQHIIEIQHPPRLIRQHIQPIRNHEHLAQRKRHPLSQRIRRRRPDRLRPPRPHLRIPIHRLPCPRHCLQHRLMQPHRLLKLRINPRAESQRHHRLRILRYQIRIRRRIRTRPIPRLPQKPHRLLRPRLRSRIRQRQRHRSPSRLGRHRIKRTRQHRHPDRLTRLRQRIRQRRETQPHLPLPIRNRHRIPNRHRVIHPPLRRSRDRKRHRQIPHHPLPPKRHHPVIRPRLTHHPIHQNHLHQRPRNPLPPSSTRHHQPHSQ